MNSPVHILTEGKKTRTSRSSVPYSTDKQVILDRHNQDASYKLYSTCNQYSVEMVKYRVQNSVILYVSHDFPKLCMFLTVNL